MFRRIVVSITVLFLILLAPLWPQEQPPQFEGNPIYRVGNGVTPPKLVDDVDPAYPKKARKNRIQGTVILKVIVAPDGKPHDIRVDKGVGYGLDEEAIKTVQKWRFQPSLRDGQPVAVQINVEVAFRLY